MEQEKCHICGNIATLTKEHVPPRSAFNKGTAIMYTGDRLMQRLTSKNFPWDFSDSRGLQVQGGIGYKTLCATCNSNTGAWYGAAFVSFTLQGIKQILTQQPGTIVTVKFKGIYPLRILKQAICMFMSINSPAFAEKYQELREFVLRRDKQTLSDNYKTYIYGCKGHLIRMFGNVVHMQNLGADFHGNLTYFSEISAVPFGYVLQLSPEANIPKLIDISEFSRYTYNEKIDWEAEMKVLEVNSHHPLDFRSKNQIEQTRQVNSQ